MTTSDGPTSTLPPMAQLPALPDPSTLWSSGSSSVLLQEARSNIAQIRALREHCLSGRISMSPISTFHGELNDNTRYVA